MFCQSFGTLGGRTTDKGGASLANGLKLTLIPNLNFFFSFSEFLSWLKAHVGHCFAQHISMRSQ